MMVLYRSEISLMMVMMVKIFKNPNFEPLHSRCFIIFLARNGRIRAVEVRPQKFRANFFRFGRISSILQPKNLLFWENFAQIERNSPEMLGAKLNCADSPFGREK
jgi:hypothetical protein